MQMASYRRVIFEGDNKTVHQVLTDKKLDFHNHNLIKDIKTWQQKFTTAEFSWVPRKSNCVADTLAKASLRPDCNFIFPLLCS